MNFLLFTHIFFGLLALITFPLAIAAKKGSPFHRKAGKYYVFAMTGIFFTALLLAFITHNVFLLLISIFSFYLCYSGWRFGHTRTPHIIVDKLGFLLMLPASLWMGYKTYVLHSQHDEMGLVLLVFLSISVGLLIADVLYYLGKLSPAQRIRLHAKKMLGASVATVTAFCVVNIKSDPAWLAWLAPTICFLPFFIYYNKK